ncbi:MAG TPA: prolyl oligopeptidase family serine peptidase, partial [bacterium]|nr:prolyl oligopeptidase family serine peptidase [bacterium]
TSSKSSDRYLPLRLLAFCLSVGFACTRNTPATVDADILPKALNDHIRDYLEIVDSVGGRPLRDGRKLFLSRAGGEVRHLFVQEPDGSTRQLTRGPDAIDDYAASPDGSKILYLTSQGGNEQYDVHLLTVPDGATRPLLADPAVKTENPVWVDDRSFLYLSNEVNKRDFYLYLYDLQTGTSRLLVEKKGVQAISDAMGADRILFHTILSNSSTVPYLLEKGTARKLKGVQEDRLYRTIGFLRDGTMLIITDEGSDIEYLQIRDRGGKRSTVHAGPWPVEQALIEKEGRDRAVFCTNEEGWSVCRLWHRGVIRELATGRGIVSLSDFTGGRLWYTLSRPDAIPRPFVLDVAGGAPESFGITDARGVDIAAFVAPETRRAVSFDGLSVPYLLFLPRGSTPPYRTITHYHGGPEGQARAGFNPMFQYYLKKGFAIAAPNVRGSTGYGRHYGALDNYKLRMDAVSDAGAVMNDLVARGVSLPDRFIAMGGSYGGFMTVASMAQFPDRYRCGVDVVGVVDFINFLKNTRSYRKALRETEYGPLEDEAFLHAISPTTMADRIKGKLFIAHGANDPRVPVSDAYILAEKLTAAGNKPEMLIFDDEGHGFRKKKNRIEFNERAASFINACAPLQ